MTEVEFSPETEAVEALVGERDLIVFNDDVNTFDHVIDSFIKICKHESVQAEQCAWIIHFSGKCQIKKGSYEELEPMCTALLDRGLSAEIQ
ncbi:MAG: ATP-dependent Clp protease adaptor protein ClpS [Crocinitomicaceae bacterium]|jgi:ATP-dependent Clp protease adaptor protein ClpS|nr:ATP-dependent Clp protease adaptor protein ClpS [Crocinitomicaceae bacterium]